jgi:hypothetical protein
LQVKPHQRAYTATQVKQPLENDSKKAAKEKAAKEKAAKEKAAKEKATLSEDESAGEGDDEGDGEDEDDTVDNSNEIQGGKSLQAPKDPKRKKSVVEKLMKTAGFVKGGTFRREQLQLELIVGVLKRFARLQSSMVILQTPTHTPFTVSTL